MPSGLLQFLQRWIVTTLAVLVAVSIVKGLDYRDAASLFLASLLLGLLNAFVRPLLLVLSLPLVVYTLGLFIVVINALLLMLVGHLVKGFSVAGFWPAVWGALVISLVSLVANLFLGRGPKVEFRRGSRKRERPAGGDHDKGGDGPVIDV